MKTRCPKIISSMALAIVLALTVMPALPAEKQQRCRNPRNHAGHRTQQQRRRIHSDRYFRVLRRRRSVNPHWLRHLNSYAP